MSSQVRRELVALACERNQSKRRACELTCVARSGLGYRSVRAEHDAPVLKAMCRLSAQNPRYGYRRIRVFLAREGYAKPGRISKIAKCARTLRHDRFA